MKTATSLLAAALLLTGQPSHAADAAPATATAIFAAGCFWCVEKDFEELPGVIAAESGYTAGQKPNPSYQEVSAGYTGHTEAVRIVYDPAKVSYGKLLDHFWRNVDPTVRDRQFCDVGSQYRSGIYWQNEAERRAAEASRDALLASGRVKQVYTEIAAATKFWPAEEYHQDYYKKNPLRYKIYRSGCGRDARLADLWGNPAR
ncbi:MAG: peptide-methionine (S)-S-oxide reductase [Betaproteobacteria bacterium HGW-Betaproteobacteria-12]|nr:MAG: peptide-methionine (S)-S-oxide reductase [Betaproteobacteria bacterium HGW-Betaproteobacteria-12]